MEYKLGKRPAKIDKRTIKLRAILKELPVVPDLFDLDEGKEIPASMMKNDEYGDCVIVARANQSLRFEYTEQNKIINITDDEVLNQYFKEGRRSPCDRKPDRGLVLLDSLKRWRKEGWTAAGNHHDIYAFAKVNKYNKLEVKVGLYLLNGLNIGLALPLSAQSQDVWSSSSGYDYIPGSWGGHGVALKPKWAEDNLLSCITWGKEQLMTYQFFLDMCDEAYAVVDNKNRFQPDSVLDVELLNSYLEEITQ